MINGTCSTLILWKESATRHLNGNEDFEPGRNLSERKQSLTRPVHRQPQPRLTFLDFPSTAHLHHI